MCVTHGLVITIDIIFHLNKYIIRMKSLMCYRSCDLSHIFKIIVIVRISFGLISYVNGERGSFIGCYRQNIYLRRLEMFSGSVDVCLEGCEHLFFRYKFL